MLIKNALTVLGECVTVKDIRVTDGVISEISDFISPADGEEILNLDGKLLLAGFIDIHTHGALGESYDNPECNIDAIRKFEASKGVTAIAATTTSIQPETMEKSFKNILKYSNVNTGSKILAIHSEGPFINLEKKGGMIAQNIRKPDVETFERMCAWSEGLLKRITLAPEIAGNIDVIKTAVSKNVRPSAGHTAASYDEMRAAIDSGLKDMTHSFNACVGIDHRNPGVLGAAFTDESVSCEVICDFAHVHHAAVKMIYLMKGCDKFIAISDSVTYTGLEKSKDLHEGGRPVTYDNGVFKLDDGTICGSNGTMHTAFCNLFSLGIPLWEISKMVSLNPARAIFADGETGSIETGKRADMVVMDKEFNVLQTFVDGKCVFEV